MPIVFIFVVTFPEQKNPINIPNINEMVIWEPNKLETSYNPTNFNCLSEAFKYMKNNGTS